MKQYSIEKLAEIINADYDRQGGFVSSVSTDSKNIKPGDCFFAIEGPNFDGHNYINEVFAKGAACAVVKKTISPATCGRGICLKVDSTVKSLGQLAAHYRNDCNFKVIAITGSVGKTTTRHIISHVLKSRYKLFQSPKNFNNQIGLPLTLLGANIDTEIVVTELGANNPGEIAYLSSIAAPDIAIVTNVYPSHLEGFGSIDKIIKEKLSITQGLKQNAKFFISGDYENLLNTAKKQNLIFQTFGLSQTCNIRPDNISVLQTRSWFQIDGVTVNVPLAGKGNLENAVTAWAVCKQFDISAEQFAFIIQSLPPVPMRAEIKQFGSVTVIDDCYNANPASVKNALAILSSLASEKNKRAVFICGDMGELGAHTEQFHKLLAADIALANTDAVLAVGQLAKFAGEFAASTNKTKVETEYFENAETACNNLHKFIKDNDIVLVKGSRSVGLEKVVAKLKQIFDKTMVGTDKN